MMGVEHMACSLDASDQDRDRLLVLADEALYRAKRGAATRCASSAIRRRRWHDSLWSNAATIAHCWCAFAVWQAMRVFRTRFIFYNSMYLSRNIFIGMRLAT
tara:strand:+ start:689 stop:994 length:306 start_codon:yes stop_codon:yes gene_type:complete